MVILKCDHKKSKMKLVAWAFNYKGKHEQGFKMVKCCAKCGCVVLDGWARNG